ncbi:MAG: hypothetical protein ACRBFS_19250 [Aureispira sp.]
MEEQPFEEQQQIKRLLWLLALLVWCWRYWQGCLLHQLQEAPFVFVGADNTFWLYHALQIPALVIQQYSLALFLDCSWFFLALYGLWKVQQRFAGALLWLLYTNYFIIYNSIATHHEHILVAGLFCFLLLMVNQLSRFILLFVALRYYALWVLFSAALWKIGLGSWNDTQHLEEILKHQHISLLVYRSDDLYSQAISWLIQHPFYTQLLWYIGFLVELSFGIGFFTRRWDKILGILWLLFFIMDYCLIGLCFAEFCIFALVFYPWREIWNRYQHPLHNH